MSLKTMKESLLYPYFTNTFQREAKRVQVTRGENHYDHDYDNQSQYKGQANPNQLFLKIRSGK